MNARARCEKTFLILGGVCVLALIAALVFSAFQNNLLYFFSPSQIAAGEAPIGKTFRVSGHVKKASIQPPDRAPRFEITDGEKSLAVVYSGRLPDLFLEGRGAVVQGRLDARGVFFASEVLAKHDEHYMPTEKPAKVDAKP
ncbi:MAG: cytochrome c maturation protein CcmE [Candidatus Accumulibacter sp.]|jgi:cytochrome c-type biogenesis protein CcmE|nr:cytochrome c maturation protein CcmE [Accumulibacter sp.]